MVSAGPCARTATGQHSFAISGPRTWNSLPADLRTPDKTLCSFKRHLKAHLFSSSLRCCWQAGSAPFIRRHCECLASSAPFTNIQTYLLTYLITYITITFQRSLTIRVHWHQNVSMMDFIGVKDDGGGEWR